MILLKDIFNRMDETTRESNFISSRRRKKGVIWFRYQPFNSMPRVVAAILLCVLFLQEKTAAYFSNGLLCSRNGMGLVHLRAQMHFMSSSQLSNFDSHQQPLEQHGEEFFSINKVTIDSRLSTIITEYLSIRLESIENLASVDKEKQKEDIKIANKAPASSPLGMVKPTGWFKDVREIDIQARSDRRTPLVPHPLSYFELKQYGYERLSEEIISLGGPKLVGEAFGIDWKDLRNEKEVWDESLRPVRKESYALDIRGELSLGTSLEDKLLLAGDIDVEQIKERLAEQATRDTSSNFNSRNKYGDGAIDPFDVVDYSARRLGATSIPSTKSQKKVIPKAESNGERFSLVGSERLFLVVIIAMSSLANGRASQDIIDLISVSPDHSQLSMILPKFFEVAKYVSLSSYAASVVSALKLSVLAKEKQRSPLLWGAIGFLGGPGAMQRLDNLQPL